MGAWANPPQELVQAILKGVAQANAEHSTDYIVVEIEYDPEDTPEMNTYHQLAAAQAVKRFADALPCAPKRRKFATDAQRAICQWIRRDPIETT